MGWQNARVVELVYTRDLKSLAQKACGSESRPGHNNKNIPK